jgi:ABC-type transport system substrate-binding protein
VATSDLRQGLVWRRLGATVVIATTLIGLAAASVRPAGVQAAAPDTVRIALAAPTSLDPAAQGDNASAQISAQLFETLTAIDRALTTRPALAESWAFRDGGATVVFHLRPNLTFSDGSPLRAADVVRSWFRNIDAAAPSPLVSLMADVEGALAYAQRRTTDQAKVGLVAEDDSTVVVRLTRPATDFPSIVASPTFAVVPPGFDGKDHPGTEFVGSGGYLLAAETATTTTLKANSHYWAGTPAIGTVAVDHDTGGRSPIDVFTDDDIDLIGVPSFDAAWIAYDPQLGPALRRRDALAVTYYGFDTSRPPFSDVRVRQAFARAVDWRRLMRLTATGSSLPATGLVPPGVPGRSDTDFLPPFDPPGARRLLEAAGFPGGAGFPEVTLVGYDDQADAGFIAEIRRELGITVQVETMTEGFTSRVETDPPSIFAITWIADYPGPNDFLGILLGTGASANHGKWSSPPFDAAIAKALAAPNAATARRAFDTAEGIVREDAPAIPRSYDVEWSLARKGLLGAEENGLGILRMAGLAWH